MKAGVFTRRQRFCAAEEDGTDTWGIPRFLIEPHVDT